MVSVSLGCCDVLVSKVCSEGDSRDSETGEHASNARRAGEQSTLAPGVVLSPGILK